MPQSSVILTASFVLELQLWYNCIKPCWVYGWDVLWKGSCNKFLFIYLIMPFIPINNNIFRSQTNNIESSWSWRVSELECSLLTSQLLEWMTRETQWEQVPRRRRVKDTLCHLSCSMVKNTVGWVIWTHMSEGQ